MAESEQNQDADGDSEDEENSIATTDKIGILFVALGQETSGEVMKFLTEYEIEEITQAVAALQNVTVEMQDRVMEEFEQFKIKE